MLLQRYATRGMAFLVILFVLLAFSPIRFPSISIERRDIPPLQAELPENALPLQHITKAALPQPVEANAPVQQPGTPQNEAPPATPLDTAFIELAWRDWMARHDITKSAMALGQHGGIAHSADAGRAASTAYPVPSLSKAVTAMCLNTLLAQSDHSWTSPLSDLTDVWETLAMRPHPELGKLPLSALVTHTSGFPLNIDVDETAGEGRNLYTQINFARNALRAPQHLGTSRRHQYSNVNFALLGQIIEGISGQPYGDICTETVMAPAGAKNSNRGRADVGHCGLWRLVCLSQ